MAASKSIREALNTLNDELLTAKLTAVAFNNLHADIEASRRLLHDPHAWVFVVVQMVDRLERASEALGSTSATKALPVLKTWKSPGRSKPGAGEPSEPRKGVAERSTRPGHPQDNQRSDGRRRSAGPRVHCTFVRLCLSCASNT
jgi:hypothetical protein